MLMYYWCSTMRTLASEKLTMLMMSLSLVVRSACNKQQTRVARDSDGCCATVGVSLPHDSVWLPVHTYHL